MYYPEHILETIRERSDIVTLISEYTTLTKKGNSHIGLCPFHNEKTPSFSVSEEKQLYYCFGCGAGGNTVTFLMQKENMTFPEAIKYLAERENIELEELALSQEEIQKNQKKHLLLEITKEAAKFFYLVLKDPRYEEMMRYLTDRGITGEMIKQFGLGYSPAEYNSLYKYLHEKGYKDDMLLESGLFLTSKNGGFLYDRFASRIIFPIFDTTKKVIGFGGRVTDGSMPKYLNSPENMLFNKSYILYGLHLAKTTDSSYYILVEGYMDVIAMHQAGFTQTVASLGTAFTPLHAKLLKRYTKEVVIMYDSDQAGINATLRAIPILKKEGIKVRVLQLKEGKDPDEYLKKYGKAHLAELIEGSKSDVWFEISRLELQYDLQKSEQKVIFLQEIATLLGDITSSIEQAVYIDEICEAYQIEKNAFQAEVNQRYKKAAYHSPVRSKNEFQEVSQIKRQTMSREVVFLAVLYHYPQVVRAVKAHIRPEMFEGSLLQDLAREILQTERYGGTLNMTYFTSRYPDSGDQNMISYIMMHKDERYEEQAVLHKMLLENIKRLKESYISKKMNSTKDAAEKQSLLFQKKELNKLYIDFING